jgi:uncharacterized tellurite resistance protein B-like protein
MWSALKSLFDVADQRDDSRTLQLAAAALLIEVSKADYVINYTTDNIEQQAVVAAIRQQTGLQDDELNTLLTEAQQTSAASTSLYEFTSLINANYSEVQKFNLIRELWRVAAADGEIHKYEDHLIRQIAELLYVPHAQFIRAKLEVLSAV